MGGGGTLLSAVDTYFGADMVDDFSIGFLFVWALLVSGALLIFGGPDHSD